MGAIKTKERSALLMHYEEYIKKPTIQLLDGVCKELKADLFFFV